MKPIVLDGPMVNAILQGKKTQLRGIEPLGIPGDELYVCEGWANYSVLAPRLRSDGGSYDEFSDGLAAYRADGYESIQDLKDHIRLTGDSGIIEVFVRDNKWIPACDMPRWASRMRLTIESVRSEWLHDISEEDARSQGMMETLFRPDDGFPLCYGYMAGPDDGETGLHSTAKDAFEEFWASTCGAWELNPSVWVVDFKYSPLFGEGI